MILERVISGGQTGADQAGWRAAKAAGIVTGGWMPRGFLTEDGPRPEFAGMYGAREHESREYLPRTRQNVADAHATLIFGDVSSSGSRATMKAVKAISLYGWLNVDPSGRGTNWRPSQVAEWIDRNPIEVLNVAGNRESSAPGIGRWVEAYLAEVFRLISEVRS